MILILSLIILYMFYAGGGFRYLIKAAQLATEPEPETVQYKPAPAEKLLPDHIKPAGMTRKQLEKAACDCLYLTGAKFDIYTYCMNSTDYELMTIIKDFNIYHA